MDKELSFQVEYKCPQGVTYYRNVKAKTIAEAKNIIQSTNSNVKIFAVTCIEED
ncbi:hypothetical protein IHV09_09970 [Fictibacillus sp. 23RED33]|uniref:hypothetical protein n=1 Tax=Fictibacillus sp. 23RED33 TaxID=2745879 RepID=UPI0018CD013E|nr:hypothetical protein [Fictibacillus sp. 23RED33]MBH0173887.1 hypothetical protein [Fictibacillus sp. 23RED33]